MINTTKTICHSAKISTLFEWLTIKMKHDKIRAEMQLEAVVCI